MPVEVNYVLRKRKSWNEGEDREDHFDTDEGPRTDTSLEVLGKLKPAFHVAES